MVLPGLLLAVSCKRDVITYYTNGIKLSNYDNSGSYLRAADVTVKDSCYVLRIDYTSDQSQYYTVDDDHRYEPGNLPTSIFVRALEAFDSTHPAGSLLNEYFIAGPGINSSVDDVVYSFQSTRDYYPTHDPDDLWLMVPPSSTGPFHFTVEMQFNDGVTVRDTTSIIYFVP